MRSKKGGFSFLKRIAALLFTLALLFVFFIFSVRTANVYKFAIDGENAVDEELYADINGSRQFLRMRGQDADNPVMLFLHGGPANPLSCVSYLFLDELYDDFTVCEWDQRGCGRTYFENEGDEPPEVDEILEDIDAITDMLLEKFDKERIILMGYSWGSVVGIEYATAHPEKLSGYIGVGQCVSLPAGIECDYAAYENSGADMSAVKEDYTALKDENNAEQNAMHAQRLISVFQNELGESGHDVFYYFLAAVTGADTSVEDLRWKMTAATQPSVYLKEISQLAQYMYCEFDAYSAAPALEIPVLFISGEGDVTMPVSLIGEYESTLKSPYCEVKTIKGAGHSVMFDAPEEFGDVVYDFARTQIEMK